MSSIFLRYKDALLDLADRKNKSPLKFPLKKTGNLLNNYNKGDFIVVGGRKTSGKSSFILHNYVISPLIQKLNSSKEKIPLEIKVIFLNTRKNPKSTLDRMIVNYTSQKNKGNKVGVPSIYGFDGNHRKISQEKSKGIISSALDRFDALSEKGFLSVISSKKSIFEVDNIIRASMAEYGTLDDVSGEFTYDDAHKELLTIVVIDDITGIYAETGNSNLRSDNSHLIASKLRDLTKVYNLVTVLAVPSANVYSKSAFHTSTSDEIFPYGVYADRSIILHNPAETAEKHMLGYDVAAFINARTGICYLRTAFVASNYMGPSNLSVGYLMYPENGFMLELPASENIDEVDELMFKINEE